jgi:hypothetical protein
MEEMEYLRQKLYETIRLGNADEILRISQELDNFVLYYTKKQLSLKQYK